MEDIILFFIYVAMSSVAELLFWISFIIVVYTYAGYPLLMLALVSMKKRPSNLPPDTQTPVTLIVAACNEEYVIEEKIKNTLALDYPPDLLKIIFVTDGSTDLTPSIVEKYAKIKLLHESERKGKLAAMNRAMQYVETDVVIFSDANGMLNKECVKNVLRHYTDEKVGGVTGEKKIKTSLQGAVSEGEGIYWRYESFLKEMDSRLYSVVGAAGELFSIRTSLYETLSEDIIIEDFVQSLLLCIKGYRVKYDASAWSEENASLDINDEMERKIRISAGGFQAMSILRRLFNVFRYPVVFFQYFSHRVLRWTLCPLALIVLFFSSLWINTGFFKLLLLAQAIFYAMAFVGWIYAKKNRKLPLFYLSFYFVFMNFCVFMGFIRYLKGNQVSVWKKATRN